MIDYSQNLERLEKALGQHCRDKRFILGEFGSSLALKVDPFYYLAIQPGFLKHLSRWAGMLPAIAAQTLIRTGALLSDPSRTVHAVPVRVLEEGSDMVLSVRASFVLASFIDRALAIHGATADAPPVSRLRILDEDRPGLAFLFQGKTPLQSLAFANPQTR
jgi:hypothetical protein